RDRRQHPDRQRDGHLRSDVPVPHWRRRPQGHRRRLGATDQNHRRSRAMTRINPRIRGLAAVVLILVVLFGTPMLLIFVGATPWSVDWSQLRMLLLSPDDGT